MNRKRYPDAGDDRKTSTIRENGSKNTGNIFVARHPLCIAGIVCNYVPSSVCFGQFSDRPQYWDTAALGLNTVATGWDTAAIGWDTVAIGWDTVAIGWVTVATGWDTGYRMVLSHPHSQHQAGSHASRVSSTQNTDASHTKLLSEKQQLSGQLMTSTVSR